MLKDTQNQERNIILELLLENMQGMEAMSSYLQKCITENDSELEKFKKMQDKERTLRIKDLKDEHNRKMKEMKEKQERLLNVEEALRKDEIKYMERFKRQREEMLARKLAD